MASEKDDTTAETHVTDDAASKRPDGVPRHKPDHSDAVTDASGQEPNNLRDTLEQRYADNGLFTRLLSLELAAPLRVTVDGISYPIWKMSVHETTVQIHTSPITAFSNPCAIGTCVPYDVSSGIAATIDHKALRTIEAILPNGDVVNVTSDDIGSGSMTDA